VEIIEQGRKLLLEMMIGPVAGHKKVLESLIKYGNPYEKPATKRLDWLKELEKDKRLTYKKIPGDAQTDTLLFVGCTASFEDNIQKVARSMVLLLERAKARYGILDEETCCGSPSRRIGDEGLFGELSETVTRVINEAGLSHIVTISPHCYNTFKHEYPEPFRKLNIQHYTEYLSEMIETGKLSPQKKIKKTITFHDPCYLGKRNGVYDAPRKILSAIPGIKLVEMESNKGNSLCCGGGGGRMWIEVDEVRRMSHIRLEEALNTSAEIIATACPWCNIQLEDAIRTSDNEGKIEVKDISELLLSSLS
jgi:Fe-S oxidoreductase